MKGILEQDVEKNGYVVPAVEIYECHPLKDVLCMSDESKDNDFDAGSMDGFIDN